MFRIVFLVALGGMGFLMASGAEDGREALTLALIPVSAALACLFLVSD